jgi:hypothetical protein
MTAKSRIQKLEKTRADESAKVHAICSTLPDCELVLTGKRHMTRAELESLKEPAHIVYVGIDLERL